MSEIFTTENLAALLTLTLLEIVLGIDNIVFLSIVTGRLPEEQRSRARRLGLALAMLMRVALLLALTWVMKLTAPLFTVAGFEITGKNLILIGGGVFLIAKSTHEIHARFEDHAEGPESAGKGGFAAALVQIMLLDVVFSLDSVITAVGMAQALWVMVAAVIVAVLVMMVFANVIADFVERHPTIKMLALAFLILIGVLLVAEGTGRHVEKGYVYFAMAFSLAVEMLNLRWKKKHAQRGKHS